MVHSDTDFVIVGKVGATYGIKGWLKIFSYTEEVAAILEYAPWYIKSDNTWKNIQLEKGQLHGKGIIAKFKEYDVPETARLLTGKEIAVLRTQLPALTEDEYYWSDLEGLTVVNQNGTVLGKVIYLLATGANDVLVVKGVKEHAIPYLWGQVIKKVDLAQQVIHVDWDVI